MARYKHLIGPRFRARSAAAQAGEAALAVQVLNPMIREAKPVSMREVFRLIMLNQEKMGRRQTALSTSS